jgi:flavin-dependent dehydrogenase
MTTTLTYDALIIGAGPAGCSTALRLKQAGLSVILVEKHPFPRFRIGESLLPNGNALLREIGVWPKIEQAGFIPKFGARFLLGSGDTEKKVLFSTGLIPGLDSTYQVDRAQFDGLLLDQARELGVEVRLQSTVKSVNRGGSGHTVDIESDGTTTTVVARWVIDAGGRDHFFPSELKSAMDPAPFAKRIAIYNHFHQVPRASGSEAGDTVIVRLPVGWFWIIPIDDRRTSVGLVTTLSAMKATGATPADYFNQVVADTPRLRELMTGAVPVLEYQVTADYSYYRRELASGRFVLAGDAGGFLDPIFSSGVYLALYSAKHAAEMIVRAHHENRELTARECARYTRRLKRHASVFHRLIEAFYNDNSFAVFMCAKPPWGLAPTITSIVAGYADLTWPMWLRFQLFLLVCRLQSRLPLVDPVGHHLNMQPTSAA